MWYMVDQAILAYIDCIVILYSAKFRRSKTLTNRSFWSFGEKNVGEFTTANISYFTESGIWLGKILGNDKIVLPKSPKFSPATIWYIATYILR